MTQMDRSVMPDLMSQSHNICVRLFDEIERKRIEQNIRMFNKSHGEVWNISSASEARVIVFSVDEPGGELFYESCSDGSKIIPVLYAKENRTDCPWFINRSDGTASCTSVLESLHDALNEQFTENGNVSEAESIINSSSKLEELVDEIKSNHFMKVSYKQILTLFINNVNKTVFVVQPETNNLCLERLVGLIQRIGVDNLNVESVSESEFSNLDMSLKFAFPLSSFYWELIVLQENKRLFSCVNKNSRLRIKNWPSFTKVSHKYEHVLLASFLKRYSANIETITAKLNLNKELVYFFINAASAMDNLIEASDSLQNGYTMAAELKPRNKTLMQQIIKKLMKEDVE